jgi:geranylgeranyl pyrophosphate synthase
VARGPKVAVEQEEFDFGTMERESLKSHSFAIRNTGRAPLRLTKGETTCRCTKFEIVKAALAPGEATQIELEWRATVPEGPFRQTATIETNDPLRPQVTLTIAGKITNSQRVSPDSIVFSGITANEPHTAEVRIYSYRPMKLEVLDEPKLAHEETAGFFEIEAVPAPVADAMRYSLLGGGKRLRPILCLASADAVGGRSSALLRAACAIELIHTYSLVHDDLPAMDDDSLRRGRPTLHVVAGEGMAILAGDGLLTEAFALLAREPHTDDPAVVIRKLRVIGVVATAAGATGMVGGQAIDLASVATAPGGLPSPPLDAEGLQAMHAKKTGALIRASAVAGAIMGGAGDPVAAAVDAAAAELGLAFQIVDDILDVEGASTTLGKTAGKDAAAGKPTYPSIFGIERSRTLASDCLARAAGILETAGLADTRLLEIGRWIVERGN